MKYDSWNGNVNGSRIEVIDKITYRHDNINTAQTDTDLSNRLTVYVTDGGTLKTSIF